MATSGQIAKFEKDVVRNFNSLATERAQIVLGSGLLSDVLNADPERLKNAFVRNTVRRLFGLTPLSVDFPTWRKVKIYNDYRKIADHLDLLEHDDVGPMVAKIFKKLDVLSEVDRIEIEVVRLRIYDICLEKGLFFEDICNQAKSFHLRPLPPEAVIFLRDQYRDQPMGERLVVVIDPIEYNGKRYVFSIGNSPQKGLSLYAHGVDSIKKCDESKFLFMKLS